MSQLKCSTALRIDFTNIIIISSTCLREIKTGFVLQNILKISQKVIDVITKKKREISCHLIPYEVKRKRGEP